MDNVRDSNTASAFRDAYMHGLHTLQPIPICTQPSHTCTYIHKHAFVSTYGTTTLTEAHLE